jgi:hypothetical protein
MEQDENLNHLCFKLSRPGYPTIASRYLISQSPSTYYSDCNNCPRYLVDGRPICWIESIICVNFMLKVSFEQPLEKKNSRYHACTRSDVSLFSRSQICTLYFPSSKKMNILLWVVFLYGNLKTTRNMEQDNEISVHELSLE